MVIHGPCLEFFRPHLQLSLNKKSDNLFFHQPTSKQVRSLAKVIWKPHPIIPLKKTHDFQRNSGGLSLKSPTVEAPRWAFVQRPWAVKTTEVAYVFFFGGEPYYGLWKETTFYIEINRISIKIHVHPPKN